MIFIEASLGCRDCLQKDGMRNIYPLVGGDVEQYKEKTEFEVMTIMEAWNVKENKSCDFCGSTNLEVSDIAVDKYPLYDFNRVSKRRIGQGLTMLMINIDKIDSVITARPGGSSKIMEQLFYGAFDRIIDFVNDRPQENFVEHTNGNFFICIAGYWDYSKSRAKIIIERYRCHGLTREEVLSEIQSLINV